MSKNEVSKNIYVCKDCLQQSHDVAKKCLPSINNEAKEIADDLSRIRKKAPNSNDKKVISNANETFFENSINFVSVPERN